MMPIFDNGNIDQNDLNLIRTEIERQLNWGSGNSWRNQDFQELSVRIYEKTGEQLSHTTLKRLWGKLQYHSLPNTHTLNTLARFADFENWVSFKSAQKSHLSNMEITSSNEVTTNTDPPFSRIKLAGMVFFLLGIFFVIISLIPKKEIRPLDASILETVKFSSHPVAKGVPNTVVFNYDVSKIPSNDIQIQQNWDERRRFAIRKDQFEVTSTYYYPGHWKAKLVVDGQVIKEHDIHITTDDWVITMDREPMPRYLREDEVQRQDYLGVAESIKSEIAGKSDAPERMTYHLIQKFPNLSSENFSLEIALKNTYFRGDGVCQFSRIVIDCTEGIFLIPFSIPGCVGDINLRLSDVYLSGKNHDFSAFGVDFKSWQRLRMEVEDRKAIFYLNGQKIFESPTFKSAGKIAGIKVNFVGSGAIDDIKLKDDSGQVVYFEDFTD